MRTRFLIAVATILLVGGAAVAQRPEDRTLLETPGTRIGLLIWSSANNADGRVVMEEVRRDGPAEKAGFRSQRAACPSIEVSLVVEAPSDSNRSFTLADGRQIALTEEPLLTTADVTGARASLTEGQYVVNVDVNTESAKRIQAFSEQHVGRRLAFLVDGQLVRTPRIRDPITGTGVLIGAFERAEAERLAEAINIGCGR